MILPTSPLHGNWNSKNSITDSCFKGNMQNSLDFDLEDVSGADNGCGATFMGQFWYFGDDRKVSLIIINVMKTAPISERMLC